MILFACTIRGQDDAAQSVLAERRAVAADHAAFADRRSRQGSRGRPARDQRHRACDKERLPVVRLSAGIRSTDDDLQSLCALGGTWCLGAPVPRACDARTIGPDTDDRLHPRQGPPLGLGRKKGEQNQAIGRSRGGRNTKIHAIADAKGRLLSILLTGGEAHDCPPAQRLIRRSKIAKKLLGDKAYDSEELRLWLTARGTKPVVPNRSNRKQPFSFDRKSYKQRHRIENAFCRLKDFRRIATRYDRLARNFLASVCLVAAIVWWVL
jgi:transposase